tara:strand:+ start:626 stop:958 length:333 start_codon:yes stop_codon:yes gene_type:complete
MSSSESDSSDDSTQKNCFECGDSSLDSDCALCDNLFCYRCTETCRYCNNNFCNSCDSLQYIPSEKNVEFEDKRQRQFCKNCINQHYTEIAPWDNGDSDSSSQSESENEDN